ncbi:hypothetical protein D5R93_02680 [Actinomyces lilanjuaniae]|uniref:YdbS-like PH domain-containing protein n=2 Tax=Actinomyces lilanjuaniae TaxID=2321394 RepID=A0ABN5PQX8_9ACTO|nr:hypothetical protein D5R93_02680 [Actinomyces lilanjuaniae]
MTTTAREVGDVGARSPGRGGAAAAEPRDVVWHRVSVVTPFLEGWKTVTGVLAVILVRNIEETLAAYRYLREHGTVLRGPFPYLLAVIALLLLGWAVLGLVSWWRRSYAVDADGVYLRSGILVRRLRVARLSRIQSVSTVYPLLGRLLGLGRLTVEVAGGRGSRVVISFLRARELSALRDQIRRLTEAGPPPGDHPEQLSGDVSAGQAASGVGTTGLHQQPPAQARVQEVRGARASRQGASGGDRRDDQVRGSHRDNQEQFLYEVGTGVLIGSILRSVAAVGVVLGAVSYAAVVLALVVLDGTELTLALLLNLWGMLAFPVICWSYAWQRLTRGWRFRALATPQGIRMRYGLTSETTRTLPPGRVHAVSLAQPLLWRRKDWWTVETSVAGMEEAGEAGSSRLVSESRLLPVGSRQTALLALGMVVPDLGLTGCPPTLVDGVLSGRDDDGVGDTSSPVGAPGRGLIRVPRRARLFSPLAWRRDAVALTETCVLIRGARWTRRVSVVPYERVQSIRITQGSWARRWGLAGLRLDMVSTSVTTSVGNLALSDATALAQEVSLRALRRRRAEEAERWMERAARMLPGGGQA